MKGIVFGLLIPFIGTSAGAAMELDKHYPGANQHINIHRPLYP